MSTKSHRFLEGLEPSQPPDAVADVLIMRAEVRGSALVTIDGRSWRSTYAACVVVGQYAISIVMPVPSA